MAPFTVYRFYDVRDELLYIGRTKWFPARLEAHRRRPWWAEVAVVELEHFDTAREMRDREAQLIHALQPRYNVVLKGSAVPPPAPPRLLVTIAGEPIPPRPLPPRPT